MRILILSNSDIGIYKFRRELLEVLSERHEVFVCVPAGEYCERIRAAGCKLIPCEALERRGVNPVMDLRLLRFYRKQMRSLAPDVVLTYTIKPNVYGGMAAAGQGVPCLANVTGLGTAVENGGLLGLISISLYRLGLRRAACVFFQNEENQKTCLDRGICRGRYRRIPGSGVNLKQFQPEPYPDSADGIRFLFAGRIVPEKGIREALKAVLRLHREDPTVTMDVVGWSGAACLPELEQAVAEGAVRFHGPQDDLRPFYRACHCAVLPSYHEGTANVMLEASATARPVITTEVPGCRETFEEGVSGLGCPARDAAALYAAMRRFTGLSQDRRALMGLAARRRMERLFDRETVLNIYLEELDRIERSEI